MPHFSYDPSLINDGGINQMRFELGDVFTLEPDKETYLTDEEITAAIEGATTWARAKLRLVDSLISRFSYEVDTKVDEVEWKLNQRVNDWKDLRKRLAAEVESEDAGAAFGFLGKRQRPAIFNLGMHDWR